MDVPAIYLYPSNTTKAHDKVKYKFKGDNLSSLDLLRFIEKNAGT
jgi:hypothetical protein